MHSLLSMKRKNNKTFVVVELCEVFMKIVSTVVVSVNWRSIVS